LREAAKQTFSESSLKQSKALHGDSALKIERRRLSIYEKITSQENLVYASINMHKIFPEYQYITDWKLRVEVGAYCPNADLGHADAQKRIADIYSYGLYNVKQDLQRAYVWYSLATNGGDSDAKVSLAQVASNLAPEQLKEAELFLERWEPGQCKRDLFRNSLGMGPEINNESKVAEPLPYPNF
jgi:TPR repeat protein